MKNSFRLVPFLICLAVPLVPGFIVGMLTSGSADIYERIKTPVFAPPAAVFPIAWGILYALMGISLYLIYRNGGVRRNYVLFGVQLLINLVWPSFSSRSKPLPPPSSGCCCFGRRYSQ